LGLAEAEPKAPIDNPFPYRLNGPKGNSMKKLILITLLLPSLGAFAGEKKGFRTKVDFQFQDVTKSFQLKHESILAEDAKDWTPLGPAQSGVALLGKIEKIEVDLISVNYMIVDTSVTPVAVRYLKILTPMGKESRVITASAGEKMSVGMTAQETTYIE
jgi:hypothetical protein